MLKFAKGGFVFSVVCDFALESRIEIGLICFHL